MKKFAFLLLLPLLGACALFPLSEADCKGVNWREKGYADGYGGMHRQDMRYIPECKRLYGAEVNEAQYAEGWQEGYNEWDRMIGSKRKGL